MILGIDDRAVVFDVLYLCIELVQVVHSIK